MPSKMASSRRKLVEKMTDNRSLISAISHPVLDMEEILRYTQDDQAQGRIPENVLVIRNSYS